MKRKLNDDQVPSPVAPEPSGEVEASFTSLALDPRILQAVVKQQFSKPSPVQAKAIPLALEGKDILGTSSA